MPRNRFNFHNQCTRRTVLLAREVFQLLPGRERVDLGLEWSWIQLPPCDQVLGGRSGVLLTSLTEPIGLSTSDRLPPNGISTKFEQNALDTHLLRIVWRWLRFGIIVRALAMSCKADRRAAAITREYRESNGYVESWTTQHVLNVCSHFQCSL